MATWKALRAALRDSGLTSHELAKIAGLNQPTVWRYLHTDREPSLSTAERLAATIGMRLALVPESWANRVKQFTQQYDAEESANESE